MQRTRSSSGGGYGASMRPSAIVSHHQHQHHQVRAPPPPPAPASSAASKTQECHICLEDLREDLAACPCGHVFHEECITQALQLNEQCPSCRGFASVNRLVKLFLELAGASEPSSAEAIATTHNSHEPQVAALSERVSILIDRLQWQKQQHDLLVVEMKRARRQTEQLLVDKQTLLHRVGSLESNKNELLSKVAKYQIELSRQTEVARQMAVNQSIINYLNTCNAEALEDEVQNPRELVIALKKACKFRHDQYQKAVKEKAKLKSMVQSLQQQLRPGSANSGSGIAQEYAPDRPMKGKLKSPMESKRPYSSSDYATPHTAEHKKRKVTISPAGMGANAPLQTASFNSSSTPIGNPLLRVEPSSFRSSAYTDVSVRPMATSNLSRAQTGFGRSNFNPNQYGSYNLVPSREPPVQASDNAVCRRGYDQTGKLTNYFIPKESKRPSHSNLQTHVDKTAHQYGGSSSVHGTTRNRNGVGSAVSSDHNSRPSSGERRGYPLTSWLRKGQ